MKSIYKVVANIQSTWFGVFFYWAFIFILAGFIGVYSAKSNDGFGGDSIMPAIYIIIVMALGIVLHIGALRNKY